MRVFFLLIISIFSLNSFCSSERSDDFQIDWKYTAGKYLIFDCERSHYACVDLVGQENCLEERKYAEVMKSQNYPCAPLQQFPEKVDCIHKMYKVVDIGANKRFCFPK